MPKATFSRLTLLSLLLVLVVIAAHAAGLKPGLWETKVVKQVVDGRDMTAQLAASTAQMQQMMANMTPEQRARIQSMPGAGFSGNGTVQICVSPEMAKRDQPIMDNQGHCPPANVKHDGNVTIYEFSCSSNGSTRQGKGETTTNGDVVTNRLDMTMQGAGGKTHTMHIESEMRYIGADCGSVKPAEPSS